MSESYGYDRRFSFARFAFSVCWIFFIFCFNLNWTTILCFSLSLCLCIWICVRVLHYFVMYTLQVSLYCQQWALNVFSEFFIRLFEVNNLRILICISDMPLRCLKSFKTVDHLIERIFAFMSAMLFLFFSSDFTVTVWSHQIRISLADLCNASLLHSASPL